MTTRLSRVLANCAAILVCLVMTFPIFSTLVLSFKQQADVSHNPPLLFPCNSDTALFDIRACRFFTEGYERIISLKTTPGALFCPRKYAVSSIPTAPSAAASAVW